MFDNILICATDYVFYRNLSQIGEHNRTCVRISRCACMRMCANIYELRTNAYDIHTHMYATCTSNDDNISQNTNMFD